MHPYVTIGISVFGGFVTMALSVMVITGFFLPIWKRIFHIRRNQPAPLAWALFNLTYSAASAALGGFVCYYLAASLGGERRHGSRYSSNDD